MSHAPGPYFARFVKFTHDLALFPFADACPPCVIGKVFKLAVATPPVEPFIAEWFVVAGSVGDANIYQQTETQMKAEATFIGFDFTSVWSIDEGNDFPKLQWEP